MSDNKVQAVLSVQDQGYFNAMERAKKAAEGLGTGIESSEKKTGSFLQTMGGMASAIGITSLISKGFSMVSDSVGKAIARIDTMDSFERTMTLMTGSTDKAESALERLKEQATGTAYGLDVTAKATQGLVTSGVDIKDSTRLVGGWMDAVATYGDGTNATLDRVMLQLGQMASKGKANLGDLKSAMEAGIPVIQMYAEATGQSAEDVNKSISKGEISATDFLETIDKAFREGTRSFAGIEGAAKNAGSSWQGTFDNMSAATTRGMLSIIQSIEDARASKGLPGMKDMVAEFGKSSEKSLKAVGEVAGFVATHFETLSATLVTGLSVWAGYRIVGDVEGKLRSFQEASQKTNATMQLFLGSQSKGIDISKTYANALKSEEGASMISAAAKKLNIALDTTDAAGKTVLNTLSEKQKALILAETGALSLKSLVTGVLSGKITLATAAQIAWNIAMKANPIGMIVAGVAALGSALFFLNKKLNETSVEHRNANKEAERLADSNDSLVKSTESLGKSYQENSTDAKANAAEAKRMVENIEKIQSSTMDATEKQMRMKDAVGELNSAYPELGVELDKTGLAIKGTTDSIYAQIDAMQEQAKAEAMKEYLKDLYKQQIEYEVSIDSTNKTMAEMEEQGTNTQKTMFGLGSKTTEEFKKLQESSGELAGGLSETSSKIAEMEEALAISSEAQLQSRLEQDRQKESLQALNEAYGVTTFAIKEYADSSEEDLEKVGDKVLELSAKYDMSADKIMESVNKTGLSLKDWEKRQSEIVKVGDKFDMTADEIEEALERSGYALEDWAKRQDELLKIADKYDLTVDQIEKALDKQKISLEEFAKSHDDNLKQAGDAVDTYAGTASNAWGRVEQASTISIKEAIKNMKANAKAVDEWGKNMNTLMDLHVNGSIIDYLKSLGPAGAAQGAAFIKELEKLNGGVITSYEKLSPAAKKLLDEFNQTQAESIEIGGRAARTAVEAANYGGMGSEAIQDLKDGMVAEMSGLETQSELVGNAIHLGVKDGVKKEDLKKEMLATGQSAMDGFREGIDSDKPKIQAEKVKKSVTDSMSPQEIKEHMLKAGGEATSGLVGGLDSKKSKEAAMEMNRKVLEGMQKDKLKKDMLDTGQIALDGFKEGFSVNRAELSGEDVRKRIQLGLNKKNLEEHMGLTGRDAMTSLDKGLDKTKASNSGDLVRRNVMLGLKKDTLKNDMLNSGIIAMDGMKTGLSTSRAYSAGDAVKNNVLSGLNRSGLRDSMSGTGRYAMDGLNNGLEDRRYRIYKTAESIARGVTGRFASVMQIKSPSRVFRKFGQNIDEGLILGLEDGYQDIGRAIDNTAERITGIDLNTPTAAGNIGLESAASNPLNVILNMGRNTYQAFVEDISRTQDSEVGLELKYM